MAYPQRRETGFLNTRPLKLPRLLRPYALSCMLHCHATLLIITGTRPATQREARAPEESRMTTGPQREVGPAGPGVCESSFPHSA